MRSARVKPTSRLLGTTSEGLRSGARDARLDEDEEPSGPRLGVLLYATGSTPSSSAPNSPLAAGRAVSQDAGVPRSIVTVSPRLWRVKRIDAALDERFRVRRAGRSIEIDFPKDMTGGRKDVARALDEAHRRWRLWYVMYPTN